MGNLTKAWSKFLGLRNMSSLKNLKLRLVSRQRFRAMDRKKRK